MSRQSRGYYLIPNISQVEILHIVNEAYDKAFLVAFKIQKSNTELLEGRKPEQKEMEPRGLMLFSATLEKYFTSNEKE